ncbi:hypothetical protein KCU81_g292, partial [Aureobasidium melanogenum]|uniref:YTH domain-containing protein n=1 Tax=Aureobasidium melanogenum (strain CBS 110374) TaxID=1043003 RepID=A0A074WZ00_AURM1
MPPTTPAGSAHFNSPKPTSGVSSASNSQEVSQDSATGEIVTAQRNGSSAVEPSDYAFLTAGEGTDYYLEVFKRRRIIHNPTVQRLAQQHLARASFNSDSVKALFNSEPSATTSDQPQSNGNASMPAMATSFGPSPFNNIAGLSGPDGPVRHLQPPELPPVFTGNTDNQRILDFIESTGSASRGVGVSRVPFNPQPTGFMIPGLGALVKPLDLDDKKTTVSSLTQTRPLLAEPHSHDHDGSSDVSDLPQQSASNAVDASVTQTPSKTLAADQTEKPLIQDPASPTASAAPNKLQVTTSPPDATKDVEYVRPSGPPPVWVQKQAPRSFKQVRAQNNNYSFETFGGASSILSGMNPDHYSMPYGSQVVAIKCPNLDDILMSHQTGFWATNQNVMTRIMGLHTNREDPSMKTLFLWSMPGSKHFCGLSELQAFDPDVKTDFWDKETGKWVKLQGSMMISWTYNKLVPYEEVIPLVEGKIDQVSITQMWNGMYYTEGTGREVVKAYVEAPHVENLLAAPTVDFFRRAMEHSKIATVPPVGPRLFGRGSYRGRGTYRPTRRGTMESGKSDGRIQPASIPGSVTKQEGKRTVCAESDAASPEQHHDRGKPELQILPVLKYADGTMTTAPDAHGKTMPVTPHKKLASTEISLADKSNLLGQLQAQSSRIEASHSLSRVQASRVERSNSLAQTQSGHTLQSSNVPPVMRNSATIGTSLPSNEQIIHRKSGSIFNEGGNNRISFEMPPPRKPSVAQHDPNIHSEHYDFSTPRTMPTNRFMHNISTWSYNSVTTPPQPVAPKTPVSQSRSLYELTTSPLDNSVYGTPTRHGVRLPSTPSRVGSQSKMTYGFGQVPEKLRTPDSSPLPARIQLAQHIDTPRPSSRLGDADYEQDEGNNKPYWVSMLVDNE